MKKDNKVPKKKIFKPRDEADQDGRLGEEPEEQRRNREEEGEEEEE